MTPRRGIEFIKQTETGVEAFCDCGSITVLAGGEPGDVLASSDIEDHGVISVPAEGGDVAFTCPGCQTVHWITFGALQAPDS